MDEIIAWIVLIQVAVGWYLVGLVSLVQRVVYPAFAHVGTEQWSAYHAQHCRGIAPVVAIPMIIQLVAAVTWVVLDQCPMAWLNLALVALTWAITGILAVPIHRQLAAEASSPDLLKRLLRANSMRLVVWIIIALGNSALLIGA